VVASGSEAARIGEVEILRNQRASLTLSRFPEFGVLAARETFVFVVWMLCPSARKRAAT
jgi:hypothetical protein